MQEADTKRRRLLSWTLWGSLIGFLWPRFSEAANEGPPGVGGAPMGPQVAGTYLATVLHQGFPPALALITLTADGSFISNDTSDHGAGGMVTRDGPVHGTWKRIGPNQVAARTLYFAFDPNGMPIWIARTTGRFNFDNGFNSGNGTLTVERFKMNQDPLDPRQVPSDSLNATMTARRIIVP
jgi:hypothetical protein